VQAVEARARLAAEEEEVAEPLGGDERGARQAAREQRVRRHGRAVHEVRHVPGLDARARQHLARRGHDALLLARRAQHLGRDHAVGADEDGVGERPADVDAERGHASTARAASSPSRTA
jgi:hypothetical protein